MNKKKILLVEDDALSSEFMRLYLDGEGYDTICSSTASEACKIIEDQKPDILITDIELSDGSGFDIALRAKDCSISPRVAVSGHDKTEISKLGSDDKVFDHFVTKPVDLDLLGKILIKSI